MTKDELDATYVEIEKDLTDFLSEGGRLAIIKAPPGSGKTHLLVSVLLGLVHASQQRIAIAAQTNTQADDICRRLTERDSSIRVARFTSDGRTPPDGFPSGIKWITDKKELSSAPGITVSTSAKWALTDLAVPFDLFAVDEAWQMAWADLMQCAVTSERFLLIGDPGQIPPVVTIDVRRWETSPRAPHDPAPSVVLRDAELMADAFLGALPACRRLPYEAVPFVRPFYDFPFDGYVAAGERGVDLPSQHRLEKIADGFPLVIAVPTPAGGPPLEVDEEVAAVAAETVAELLDAKATVRDGGVEGRPLEPKDIGITSSHRIMNSAIMQALGGRFPGVRVDTPERWQGLERPVMIAVHPLSGVVNPSSFDLETGRLCVMASRHQAALIIITRDHVGETLANLVPSAEQAPGKPDAVGQGHDSHVRFWEQLGAADRIVAAG
jgi:hypothetical protein